MKTVPSSLLDPGLSALSYFKMSCFPRESSAPGRQGREVATANVMGPLPGRRSVGLLDSLEVDHMDDTGMWLWAAILTVVGLGASWLIAVWWQKRKERRS